jgi:hypothetical protein
MLSITVPETLKILIGKFTVLFRLYIANRVTVALYYDNQDN